SRLAIQCLVFALETVIYQRIQAVVCFQIDRATVTAVATVRAAPGHVFFTPETQAAVTALACFDNNGGFVYKFHGSTFCASRINEKTPQAPVHDWSGQTVNRKALRGFCRP